MYAPSLKTRVLNRGSAPDAFLDELIAWAKKEEDSVFTVNDNYDIYSSIKPQLGPWRDLIHRKAAMCEVLRVLGGFESSWNWNEGRDTTNSTSGTPCTEEAGIFQCSGNAMNFGDLKQYTQAMIGSTDCNHFIVESKKNHLFSLGFCARLLRETVNHHGPVKRKEINDWLSPVAVAEFEHLLTGGAVVIPINTPWMDEARKHLGESEILGAKDNTWIESLFDYTSYGHAEHDEVPWCAAFVCAMLAQSGYKHSHSAAAASYKTYGEPCELKPGAIVVFKWASGSRHVTFYDGGDTYLGGNQSNKVKISQFDRKYIEAVRWPVKA